MSNGDSSGSGDGTRGGSSGSGSGSGGSGGAITNIPEAESLITMTRVYDAPCELVWEAITEPKHVARWWGGPGFTNPVCEMDVRPGGRWHHVMRFPDGRELNMNFVFVEVTKPRKLVWQTATGDSGTGSVGSVGDVGDVGSTGSAGGGMPGASSAFGTSTDRSDTTTCINSDATAGNQTTLQGHGPGDVLFTVTLDALGANQTAWKMVARFRSLKDREVALAMGFAKPIEASNDRFADYLKTLAGTNPQ